MSEPFSHPGVSPGSTLSPHPPDSEKRLERLFQAVTDYAIYMLDCSGRVVTWNRGAEFTQGYAASEILGKHFSVFYPSEDIAAQKPDRELRTTSSCLPVASALAATAAAS